jgi:hypothetical protein
MPAMLHGRTLAACALVTAAFAPTVANAQVDSFLGPSVGVFFPTDGDLRDAMGTTWFSFGASRVRIDPYSKHNLGFDWNAFSKSNDGNKVFMLAGTIGYTVPLAEPGAAVRPYFAVRGGLSYIDYAIGDPAVNRVGAKRIGFNGNAELGINVGERLNVSARFDAMPSYDGFNFSGFSLVLKWGVARF